MRSLLLRKLSQPQTTRSIAPSIASFRPLPPPVRRLSSYDDDGYYSSEGPKTALVLGSSGALGRSVTHHLSKNLDMQVIGADLKELPQDNTLDAFIAMPMWERYSGVGDMTKALVSGMFDVMDDEVKIDAIICASGGWQGDPVVPTEDASEDEFIAGARAYGETIDNMMEMNLAPVLAAGYAANRFMDTEGLFVVIGATVALSPTPGMLGYGLSKVGVHHFIQTIGEISGKSVTTKSRRKTARKIRKDKEYLDTLSIVGILPTTIDTPSNRETMPGADFSEWTKPKDIAEEIGTWIQMPPLRPHSGSLVKVFPNKTGGASFNVVR
eukprot:scaffold12769_cov141-Cylindrotheca_fusiformis.AAC.4